MRVQNHGVPAAQPIDRKRQTIDRSDSCNPRAGSSNSRQKPSLARIQHPGETDSAALAVADIEHSPVDSQVAKSYQPGSLRMTMQRCHERLQRFGHRPGECASWARQAFDVIECQRQNVGDPVSRHLQCAGLKRPTSAGARRAADAVET